MLEEGNQRCGNRHDLARRDVHVLNGVRGGEHELALVPAGHQVAIERAIGGDFGVGLGDHVLPFLDCREVIDLVGNLAVLDLAIGRLEEAVAVGGGIDRERVDQADVRAFRRFDRAHPAIVRGMHVADLEARTLARQTARTQRRNTALVGDLGERVGLVHELRQLARTKEFLDGGTDRLGVDQVVRHQVVGLGLREALLDGTLDAHQAGAELVLGQFADRTHPAVAEVIDIVDLATTVAQLDQDADHREDVVIRQRAGPELVLLADPLVKALQPVGRLVVQLGRIGAAIELHASDGRQIVALLGIEEPWNRASTASSVGGSPGRIMR